MQRSIDKSEVLILNCLMVSIYRVSIGKPNTKLKNELLGQNMALFCNLVSEMKMITIVMPEAWVQFFIKTHFYLAKIENWTSTIISLFQIIDFH